MFIGPAMVAADSPNRLNHGMDNPPDPSPHPQIVALVRDLMFSSRIRSTAKDLRAEVRLVRDPSQLRGVGGSRLLVDLNQQGAIEAAQGWKQETNGMVTGFVSHVDVETVNRARAAGIDYVMARSAFVERLTDLLSGATTNTKQHESVKNVH